MDDFQQAIFNPLFDHYNALQKKITHLESDNSKLQDRLRDRDEHLQTIIEEKDKIREALTRSEQYNDKLFNVNNKLTNEIARLESIVEQLKVNLHTQLYYLITERIDKIATATTTQEATVKVDDLPPLEDNSDDESITAEQIKIVTGAVVATKLNVDHPIVPHVLSIEPVHLDRLSHGDFTMGRHLCTIDQLSQISDLPSRTANLFNNIRASVLDKKYANKVSNVEQLDNMKRNFVKALIYIHDNSDKFKEYKQYYDTRGGRYYWVTDQQFSNLKGQLKLEAFNIKNNGDQFVIYDHGHNPPIIFEL